VLRKYPYAAQKPGGVCILEVWWKGQTEFDFGEMAERLKALPC